MQHLDEGTIHAWLDGALDSTQSAEIETHIAQCAACSASVAEARGFVAGASRILNALDDVPANVLPKRTAAPLPSPARRRQWGAAPWVTGIAAALVLAIGLTQMEKDEGKQSLMSTEASTVLAPAAVVDTSAPPVVANAPAEPAASVARQARQPQASTAPAGPTARPDLAAANEGAERRDLVRSEKAAVSAEGSRVASASDVTQGTALRASAGAGAAVQNAPTQSLQDAAVQRAPSPPSPQQMKLEAVVVTGAQESSALQRVGGATIETGRFPGCYRVPQIRDQKLDQLMPKAVAAAGRAVRARAPTAEQPTAAASFAAPAPPDIIRLDTTRHPLGFLAKDARSDSSIGTWRMVLGDSARVDLLAAGLFKLTLANRTTCPEPR